MSTLETQVAELIAAAGSQVSSSQELAQEVAGKMGEIDQEVAQAKASFDNFVNGNFPLRVYDARVRRIFVDPLGGDDDNDGFTSAKSVKTFAGVLAKVGNVVYRELTITLRKGQSLAITGKLIVGVLRLDGWTHSDGITDRPVFYQASASGCNLGADLVWANTVEIHTYEASENEALPLIYNSRALFADQTKLGFISCRVHIYDNQLVHVHDGGSGTVFHRCSISWYVSTLYLHPSASGVTGSAKRIYSRYASLIAFPIDMFAVNLSIELNGEVATFGDAVGVPTTNMLTNINLEMVG